ncbi:Chemotaxis protein CheA [Phycisphaerae bacterium RAS1]|nr:Chemotaxis protein CheA [Phycisphaerae bacterium RAS1]
MSESIEVTPDLLAGFLDEAPDYLGALEEGLLAFEARAGGGAIALRDEADHERLNAVFRAAHSLKGIAASLGFKRIRDLTHVMESLFEQLRAGKRAPCGSEVEALFAALDTLRELIAELSEPRDAQVSIDDALSALNAILTTTPSTQDATAAADRGRATSEPSQPPPQAERRGRAMTVCVRFKDRFDAAIEACILHNRLNDIGELVGSEPDVSTLDGEARVERVVFRVITEHTPEEVEAIVRLYSVESVTVTPPDAVPSGQAVIEASRESNATPPAASTLGSPAGFVSDPPPVAGSGEEGAPRAGETIRVDLERLDELMNLSGELVINQAKVDDVSRRLAELSAHSNMNRLAEDLAGRLAKLRELVRELSQPGDHGRVITEMSNVTLHFAADVEEVKRLVKRVHASRSVLNDLSEAVHSLNRISAGLQKRIMQTRMVAIGPLLQRFRRVLRDIGKSAGKKVDVVLHGEATELDKRLIDELVDPLTHIVRNSVDHGLEKPADRGLAGKAETGHVTLNAHRDGRHICIEVRDDGRGIDVDAIKRKIVQRALASPQHVEQMSDHEAIQYAFKPGVSTAEQVTDLSGRGMGMDIVRTRVESMSGAVDVQSTPGQGTVVTIRLPLTLAIVSALMVRVGKCTYGLPLESVIEVITVPRAGVQHIEGRPVVRVRGRVVPLALLEWAFTMNHAEQRTRSRDEADYTVVVLASGLEMIGLVVDEAIGPEELVIKDIAANFRHVNGIAGASIMSDGTVSLILDVAELATAFAGGGATDLS